MVVSRFPTHLIKCFVWLLLLCPACTEAAGVNLGNELKDAAPGQPGLLLPITHDAVEKYLKEKLKKEPTKEEVEAAMKEINQDRSAFNERNRQHNDALLQVHLRKVKIDQMLDGVKQLLTPQTLTPLVAAAATLVVVVVMAKEGIPIIFALLMPKPAYIIETNIKLGLWANIKSLFVKEKKKHTKMDNLFYNKTTQKWLDKAIAYDLEVFLHNREASKKDPKLNFHNIIIEGPPGTGKTAMALALAEEVGFSYILLGGASLSKLSPEEALQAFDKILNIAKNSRYPVLIIIDEVDALFKKRNSANSARDPLPNKILSEFLAKVSKPFDEHIKFVFITNLIGELDDALTDRSSQIIRVDKPQPEVAKKIFKNYLKIIGEVYDIKVRVPADLTPYLKNRTGRDIEKLARLVVEESITDHLKNEKDIPKSIPAVKVKKKLKYYKQLTKRNPIGNQKHDETAKQGKKKRKSIFSK